LRGFGSRGQIPSQANQQFNYRAVRARDHAQTQLTGMLAESLARGRVQFQRDGTSTQAERRPD